MTTAAQHPHLTVVPDQPAAPLEGVVIEKAAAVEKTARPVVARRPLSRTRRSQSPVLAPGWPAATGTSRRRWVDRYNDDYPHMIKAVRAGAPRRADVEKKSELKQDRKNLRAEYRRHRLIHVGATGAWTLAGGTGLAIGTATGGLWVDLAVALGAYLYGIRRGIDAEPAAHEAELTEAPAGLSMPAGVTAALGGMTIEQLPADAKPFPVRQAATTQQLATCVLAALRKAGIPVAEVFDISRQVWGWQCMVRVSEGTPEVILKSAGDLETSFDLATGGVRPQPVKARRSCAILRLVETDPFATAPGLPYRAPKSISITDKSRIGTSVGGEALEAALSGVMALVVASSGGGKTGLLQALAEVTTACYDNITIDLDPHGDGLEDLGDAVRLTGRSHEQIEATLFFFLMLSKARARLRAQLGMGKKWKVSPEHPHFTIFFDEFPKGSDLAKLLAVQLLLVGRKEAVTLVIASQGATKFYLGESFAQMVALKIVGPCKVGDTRGVFGDGAVAEGWLPHRLAPATDTDPKDAGHIYAQGVPGRPDEPIEYAIHETPSATLRKLAAERLDAGLLEPDSVSLDAMPGVDLPDIPDLPKLLTWPALLRLCGAQPSQTPTAPIVAEALAVMDEAGVDRMRTETLASLMHLTADELKAKLHAAGVAEPAGLGPIGELKNPRGYKRDMLSGA
jgi:hypothetical protein